MDWSKARHTLESRFAAPVQGRVGVHVTRYRRAHDQEGEIWVTVDGLKVYGSSYYQFVKGRNELEPPSLIGGQRKNTARRRTNCVLVA